MTPELQAAEWIFALTGYALYVPVIFCIIEMMKQWIPEGNHKKILPPLSVLTGIIIVWLPTILPNEAIELCYRGALLGAALTGFIAWRNNRAQGIS